MVNGTKQEVDDGKFKQGRYSTAKIELTRSHGVAPRAKGLRAVDSLRREVGQSGPLRVQRPKQPSSANRSMPKRFSSCSLLRW
jgi:hypothetical protein